MEPADRNRPLDTERPVLCITPGVCFGKDLNRIGFGKGYYDRFFFANAGKTIIKAGVAFNECIWDELPANEWDIPMDILISETNIYEKERL